MKARILSVLLLIFCLSGAAQTRRAAGNRPSG